MSSSSHLPLWLALGLAALGCASSPEAAPSAEVAGRAFQSCDYLEDNSGWEARCDEVWFRWCDTGGGCRMWAGDEAVTAMARRLGTTRVRPVDAFQAPAAPADTSVVLRRALVDENDKVKLQVVAFRVKAGRDAPQSFACAAPPGGFYEEMCLEMGRQAREGRRPPSVSRAGGVRSVQVGGLSIELPEGATHLLSEDGRELSVKETTTLMELVLFDDSLGAVPAAQERAERLSEERGSASTQVVPCRVLGEATSCLWQRFELDPLGQRLQALSGTVAHGTGSARVLCAWPKSERTIPQVCAGILEGDLKQP